MTDPINLHDRLWRQALRSAPAVDVVDPPSEPRIARTDAPIGPDNPLITAQNLVIERLSNRPVAAELARLGISLAEYLDDEPTLRANWFYVAKIHAAGSVGFIYRTDDNSPDGRVPARGWGWLIRPYRDLKCLFATRDRDGLIGVAPTLAEAIRLAEHLIDHAAEQ